MPHLLWGLWEVAVDVFLQVRGMSGRPFLVYVDSVPQEFVLQRWRLRHVPQLGGIGGPAEGLTVIVTGPTRWTSRISPSCPIPCCDSQHITQVGASGSLCRPSAKCSGPMPAVVQWHR